MKKLTIRPMKYYCDRGDNGRCVEIADKLMQNNIWLWGNVYVSPSAENMFDTHFETTDKTYREYMFAMDYLSTLLSAYRQTEKPRYRDKFLEIVRQFFEFYDRGTLVLTNSDDLIVCAQTLMFIKSFSLIDYESSLREKITGLLYEHARYCYDDKNHWDDHNHGLFTDMALLHLSVLFDSLPEAGDWQRHAVERVKNLFGVAFYKDGFNNEGSLTYFQLNLIRYQEIMDFCAAYQIDGLESIQSRLNQSKDVVKAFAHKDQSFPIIGDGRERFSPKFKCNSISGLYPDAGICVLKTGNMYMTFKCKTTLQAHAHVDETSITARYQDIDLVLDCGQYNYNSYHPIRWYLRTCGSHSGIFPLFMDGMPLREYLKRRNAAGIERFDFNGTTGRASGGYELDNGAIKVRREISAASDRIEVRDSWTCASPQNMRQRFAMPKALLPQSKFTFSKQLFETTVGTHEIRYQIRSNCPSTTMVNFGVISRQYNEFESTILLDTIAESSISGEITAIITICDSSEGAPKNG